MTERQWLRSTDPAPLFRLLQDHPSERKRRLLACACGRERVKGMEDERIEIERVIRLGERWADGDRDPEAIREALGGLVRFWEVAMSAGDYDPLFALLEVASCVSESNPLQVFVRSVPTLRERILAIPRDIENRLFFGFAYRKRFRQSQAFCPIIRDIFGNPFRPITLDPAWLTSTVVQLARGIYDDRAFDWMPILADALQDAGCDNAAVLDHCRGIGPHTRGCFVVDLILEKS